MADKLLARDLGIHAGQEALKTAMRIVGTAPDDSTASLALDVAILVMRGAQNDKRICKRICCSGDRGKR